MALIGPSEASLIPLNIFTSVPAIPLKGNIIFGRLSFVGGSPEEVLGPEITYDPLLNETTGLDSDLFQKHQYVSLSPATLANVIERH